MTQFREELATPKTSLQLCIASVIAGGLAAGMIIIFRLSIDYIQFFFVEQRDDFSVLSDPLRFLLPSVGAIFIIILASFTGFKHYRMGIPFVIHRVKQCYGRLPFRSTINQFFGGIIALASGFSVGREGPAVHIGAAMSGWLAGWLRLPSNSVRTLVGCGISAAISASFNTPLAAVIFVMEVVLREYRVHLFIPVMLAAVTGTLMYRGVFGDIHEFENIIFLNVGFEHFIYLMLMGICLGFAAFAFNTQLMAIIRWFQPYRMTTRLLIAGLLTGVIGYLVPQALGSGIGAIQFAIAQPDNFSFLLIILMAKWLLTIIAIGLGIPGGIIGPVIGIGVVAGILIHLPLDLFAVNAVDYSGTYALLGMAGLLAAVLHAPLAALVAVMELAQTPEVIMPAMLVIVSAYVTGVQFCKNRSIFIQQLEFQDLSFRTSPIEEALQKTGAFVDVNRHVKLLSESQLQSGEVLPPQPEDPIQVLTGGDCENPRFDLCQWESGSEQASHILKTIELKGVELQCTLAEVYHQLKNERDGAVYIYDGEPNQFVGIITWEQIRQHLNKEQI